VRGGYAGAVLRVDLTTRTITEYPWSDEDRRFALGGKTMAARILYDLLEPGCDPLGPDNVVVVSTGPLTGTGAPSSSRFNVSALSPLTMLPGSSNCGGSFGLHLKRAGVDALVIVGSANAPVWLEVAESGVTFHDAAPLRHATTSATQASLREDVDARCGTLVIGPAGEHLVRFAGLFSDERAAGRGGFGAVFGAKNLKGIAAHGERKVEIAEPEAFTRHVRAWSATLKAHPMTGELLPAYGTGGFLPEMQRLGIVGTSNFRRGRFEGAGSISGQALASERLKKTTGCPSCPIRCSRVVEVDGREVKGPELETLVLMGANLEIDDLDTICELNVLLDDLGLDTMSTGVTLSLAMELAERGQADWPLRFGSSAELAGTLEDIAFRRGIGDILAEGAKRVGERFGGTSFSMHVKGLEFAAYEPRGAIGHGLGYATSNRGGCHLNGGYVVVLEGLGLKMSGSSRAGKPGLAAMFQDLMEAVSASGSCLFTTYAVLPGALLRRADGPLGRVTAAVLGASSGVLRLLRVLPRGLLGIPLPLIPHMRALELVTGERMRFGRFWTVGERGWALERALAVRFGVSAASDTLPERSLKEPLHPDEPRSVVPLDAMKPSYYRHRGWDVDGRPSDALLRRLGIPARGSAGG
jgi:aldehyde:ferredoxin oxidoreductase